MARSIVRSFLGFLFLISIFPAECIAQESARSLEIILSIDISRSLSEEDIATALMKLKKHFTDADDIRLIVFAEKAAIVEEDNKNNSLFFEEKQLKDYIKRLRKRFDAEKNDTNKTDYNSLLEYINKNINKWYKDKFDVILSNKKEILLIVVSDGEQDFDGTYTNNEKETRDFLSNQIEKFRIEDINQYNIEVVNQMKGMIPVRVLWYLIPRKSAIANIWNSKLKDMNSIREDYVQSNSNNSNLAELIRNKCILYVDRNYTIGTANISYDILNTVYSATGNCSQKKIALHAKFSDGTGDWKNNDSKFELDTNGIDLQTNNKLNAEFKNLHMKTQFSRNNTVYIWPATSEVMIIPSAVRNIQIKEGDTPKPLYPLRMKTYDPYTDQISAFLQFEISKNEVIPENIKATIAVGNKAKDITQEIPNSYIKGRSKEYIPFESASDSDIIKKEHLSICFCDNALHGCNVDILYENIMPFPKVLNMVEFTPKERFKHLNTVYIPLPKPLYSLLKYMLIYISPWLIGLLLCETLRGTDKLGRKCHKMMKKLFQNRLLEKMSRVINIPKLATIKKLLNYAIRFIIVLSILPAIFFHYMHRKYEITDGLYSWIEQGWLVIFFMVFIIGGAKIAKKHWHIPDKSNNYRYVMAVITVIVAWLQYSTNWKFIDVMKMSTGQFYLSVAANFISLAYYYFKNEGIAKMEIIANEQ